MCSLKVQKCFFEGVLVANECVYLGYKDVSPGLLCKLDLEKAYDRVGWGFLICMPGRMGFWMD